MTTPQMIRCKKCSYCVEDEKGNWICTDCDKEIHKIPDDDCPAEQDY